MLGIKFNLLCDKIKEEIKSANIDVGLVNDLEYSNITRLTIIRTYKKIRTNSEPMKIK